MVQIIIEFSDDLIPRAKEAFYTDPSMNEAPDLTQISNEELFERIKNHLISNFKMIINRYEKQKAINQIKPTDFVGEMLKIGNPMLILRLHGQK